VTTNLCLGSTGHNVTRKGKLATLMTDLRWGTYATAG